MQAKTAEKYFFFGFLLASLLLVFYIFRPFLAILVLGISFAIVLNPFYTWQTRHKIPATLAAFLTVVSFIVIICGPLLGIGVLVFNQSETIYHDITSGGNAGMLINNAQNSLNAYLPPALQVDFEQKANDLAGYLSNNVATIFSTTLNTFFSFFLLLVIIFYFLRDGNRWKHAVQVLSPLSDKEDEKIISRLALAVNGVIKGYLLIAVIQGVLLGLGLWFFHVPNPTLWAVVAAFASLLPVGTSIVSVPAVIFLLATSKIGFAVGFGVWALAIVGLVDNFLSPLIIQKRIDLPPLLILFAVLGGIATFGPAGILIGPLALSLLFTLISIYRNEFTQNAIL